MAVKPRGLKSQKKKKETDIFHTIVIIRHLDRHLDHQREFLMS